MLKKRITKTTEMPWILFQGYNFTILNSSFLKFTITFFNFLYHEQDNSIRRRNGG